jgi:hypothetical protein
MAAPPILSEFFVVSDVIRVAHAGLSLKVSVEIEPETFVSHEKEYLSSCFYILFLTLILRTLIYVV